MKKQSLNQIIKTSDIVDVVPKSRSLITLVNPAYVDYADPNYLINGIRYLRINVEDDRTFGQYKFEFLKMLKSKPDPADRVADFEWHDQDGIPDFEKREALIESRKTVAERNKEKSELIQSIKDYENLGLDCEFLKERLRGQVRTFGGR